MKVSKTNDGAACFWHENMEVHLPTLKDEPRRQDGSKIRGAYGPARIAINKLLYQKCKCATNIKTELTRRMSNKKHYIIFSIPTLKKIKTYLRQERSKDFVSVDETIGIVNWHSLLLRTNADKFDRKIKDY